MSTTFLKHLVVASLLANACAHADDKPHAAWQQRQSVQVSAPGLARLEVPSATLNASLPRLDDVRLVSPEGIETPFVIEWPLIADVQTRPVAAFRANLRDQRSILEMDTGTDQTIRAIILESPDNNFIKAASVEASNDDNNWQSLTRDEVVFHQSNRASQLRLPLRPASWKHLRVTLNDDRTSPVAFVNARVELERPATPTKTVSLSILKRHETKGHTRLSVPLNGANQYIAALRVRTTDPVFSRPVQVLANDHTIAEDTLVRVALDGHVAAKLDIPIHSQIQADELLLDIANGDSPPLAIEGLEADVYPVSLAFHVNASGTWQLYTANPSAHAPSYDVAALSAQLRSAASSTAVASPLAANPTFDKSATLPETGEGGAALELKNWTCRKPLNTTERGVMQVELDLEVLSKSNSSFSDLRLIQNGRQVPYLLSQPADYRESPVAIASVPDDKRPSIGRWQLKLPLASLPIHSLMVTSSTALFARSVRLSETDRDAYSNRIMRTLASSTWDQKPGAAAPLIMSVNARTTSDTLIIETDNGDNAPMQIDSATFSYPVVQLLFKTTDPSPITVYYANPRAFAPRYDLRLMNDELRAASPIKAALGAEEKLKPSASPRGEGGQGSPWLWAVLATVVGGLLWFVAKFLPQQQQ